MSDVSSPSSSPSLLSLAREIRDQIYESLLSAPSGTHSPSIPGHLVLSTLDNYWTPRTYTYNWPIPEWHWQIPVGRGSCFGILYTCRQIHTELLECINRRGGMSFELEIALIGLHYEDSEVYLGDERIWPTWIVHPLCTDPMAPHGCQEFANSSSTGVTSKCRNLDVSLILQSELPYKWLGSGGLTTVPRNLFIMLARFLVNGPLGLYRINTNTSRVWSIDILMMNVLSAGTFTDQHSDQLHTVPAEVVEDSVHHLSVRLDQLCTKGALSDRVRVVRLAVDGDLKREWLINQGERLSPDEKKEWARYGWTIDAQKSLEGSDVVDMEIVSREQRSTSRFKACCRVQ
ncbi:uncharacterized protein C8R40DRAFT_1173420 [Lentinula edodes]|uniref:uncharacterized protein n=1 Tax=Lentinula edodes TaxID=5353 RepID=UPI001E8D32FD|nr:uncharacterized protein C8R40DRAFT_1173420 [Lentinula edodes]KAH7872670.1 hypothetical protein C8R40DRAFT_1173420 [Lentinula edodes]